MSMESTTAPERTAQVDKPAFHCPSCGVFAKQTWAALLKETRLGPGVPVEVERVPGKWLGRATLRIATCQHCGDHSIWRRDRMIFPVDTMGSSAHPDMPVEVRALYEEAAAVASKSLRAGTAFARVVVERLLRTVDPDAPSRATLEQRIDRVSCQVSSSLLKLLHIVRIAGNGAVHIDDSPDAIVITALDAEHGPELVEMLLDAANRLVDELITRPAAVDRHWSALPPSKAKGPQVQPTDN
ncbi:DUF4145 domain-containing protein [Lentzea sp. BCCO 10_0856]|uniref:DUF4145 domain-containing protein n=1 Tax=Lentzea miocenica TaxID=3095431 RepID=A0ABU4T5Q3_9PSEU|nr:DUF4145 domain-containing protein [Lentzea sp. BCCO 10_0856]MDX8033482.1 DUF4145 domain-containing protein [Lentzea sp. BCCO 10_0856]